jgi:hypothetical protein
MMAGHIYTLAHLNIPFEMRAIKKTAARLAAAAENQSALNDYDWDLLT